MPRVFFFLAVSFLVSPAFCWAQEGKKASKPETTYVKLEVRGVLRISDKNRDVKMATPGADQVGIVYGGATVPIDSRIHIAAGQTSLVVDLGEDKKFHEVAEKLNGKMVVLSGELRHFTYIQRYVKMRFFNGQEEFDHGPFTMTVIRVISMKAAKPQ
jgi:hypothetical protein